jgi:ribosomal protein S18 acetylase RimI-like enzyme
MALHVDPGRWGRGLGRALITEARARLASRGFQEACLWVLADNERARRFYEIDGWSPDGARRMDGFGGVSVEEVRYGRRLT